MGKGVSLRGKAQRGPSFIKRILYNTGYTPVLERTGFIKGYIFRDH
jgi:hypothetical protein